MRAAGEQDEVGRWLGNFVVSHAKRESPRVEAVVEAGGSGEAPGYVVRLVTGEGGVPSPAEPPLELSLAEVTEGRARLEWCERLAARVRDMARRVLGAGGTERLSA